MRRRGRLVCALAGLAGAGLVVLAAGRGWVDARPVDVPGVTDVAAAGSSAAPAAPALALAAAAAAVAVLVTGRFGRRLAAAVLAVSGLGVLAACVAVLRDPAGSAAGAVAAATGRTGGLPPPAAVTPWVAVALAGGLLATLGGGYGVARASSWPAPGRRYETTPAAGSAGPAIAGPRGAAPAAPAATGGPGSPDGSAAGDARGPTGGAAQGAGDDPIGAWDALSRGEDPTTAER